MMTRRAKPAKLTSEIEPAVERKSTADQVIARILDLIRNGNLRPGDRLPPERELILIFGISRPNLREALRSLAVLKVIERRHGGGAFVTELDAASLLAPLDFFMSLSPANLIDSFDARRLIDVQLVRRAATAPSDADAEDLRTMLAAHAAVLHDPIGFRILDSRLHDKLYGMGGSAVLHRIADALYNIGLDIRRRVTAEFGAIDQSEADHRRIVMAILAQDPDEAAAAMTEHLAHIEDSTRRMLDRGSPRDRAALASHEHG